MADYRHLPKIFTIQDLILSSPGRSFPLPRLARLSQTVASLRLAPTALGFVRKFPHVFALDKREPLVKLTPATLQIVNSESAGAGGLVSRRRRDATVEEEEDGEREEEEEEEDNGFEHYNASCSRRRYGETMERLEDGERGTC